MESRQRSDCLADETVDVLLEVFEVQHVFPRDFVHTEVKRGYWSRLWDSIKARLGFGPRPVADVRGEPDSGLRGGE